MTTTPVSSGITSTGLTITSGNGVDVLNGGTVTNATLQAGSVATNSAGAMPVLSGAPAGTASAGLIIEVGGTDSGTTVQAGAVELVLGSAFGDRVSGLQFVSNATATITNETVVSGGVVDLYLAGVTATNTTVAGGTLNINGKAFAVNTTLSGGTLSLQSPKATISGSLTMLGNANTISVTALPSPTSAGLIGDLATIGGFTTGDVIDITAVTSGATIGSTSSTAGSTETVTVTSGGTTIETFLFTAGTTALLRADANGFVELVACYCPGTHILTETGEVLVEDLRVGDLVVTVSGALEPIHWIGRRSYGRRTLAGRTHLLPVRIKAGALADAVPKRDLLISPLHAMLIDGLLVPAHALLNGTTIVREQEVTKVDYVHIELAQHDAIWAEGAASETFVDDDGRFIFQSTDGVGVSQPGEALYFAPRMDDGYAVQAIRDQVAHRAAGLAELGETTFA